MKKKTDPTVLEFISTVLSVGKELTPEAQLYWSRNKKKLLELLTLQDFEPVTQRVADPFLIPEQNPTTRTKLFEKRLVPANFKMEFWETVTENHPATRPTNVYSYNLNVMLTLAELLEEIGIDSLEGLRKHALDYSQIAWLANYHSSENSKKVSLMDYGEHKQTYVPYIKPNGEIIFVGLFARLHKKNPVRWRVWFCEPSMNGLLDEGVLLLGEKAV